MRGKVGEMRVVEVVGLREVRGAMEWKVGEMRRGDIEQTRRNKEWRSGRSKFKWQRAGVNKASEMKGY